MNSNALLFAAYVIVADKKIYDSEWFFLDSLMHDNEVSKEDRRNVLNILGNTDEKIPLETILDVLRNSGKDERFEALALALEIACLDGVLGQDEENLLKRFCRETGITNTEYESLCRIAVSSINQNGSDNIEVKARRHGAQFYKLFSQIMPKRFSEALKQRYRDCLLSGFEYPKTIADIREVAKNDIQNARKVYTSIIAGLGKAIKGLQKDLQGVENASSKINKQSEETCDNQETEEDTAKVIRGITENISSEIESAKEAMNVALKKKEEAVSHFTISFIGRTKAGKSTLHSVIMGGANKEFIGGGKPRTTRFNRVYQWNGIRIVDTPGIGAPGSGGKSDTALATSVIDESDLICYVASTDNISEEEIAFLVVDELGKRNKPTIILLNNKYNISKHLGEFIKEPNAWFECKGKDSLEGHYIRIKDEIQKKSSEKGIAVPRYKIYPVHLLAAQLSQTQTESRIRKILRNGSRLDCFLDEIRIQILNEGIMRRSQSILNDTAIRINDFATSVSASRQQLMKQKSEISRKGSVALSLTRKAGEIAKKSLKNSIEACFNDFENGLLQFCETNYASKDINLKFQALSSDFKRQLEEKIKANISNYDHTLADILQEVSERLDFSLQIDVNLKFTPKWRTFSWRPVLKCLATVFTFTSKIDRVRNLIPEKARWITDPIIDLLGKGLEDIADNLETKAEKVSTAKDNCYQSAKKELRKEKGKKLSWITEEFVPHTHRVETQIEYLFNEIEKGIADAINMLDNLAKALNENLDDINRSFALRILQYTNRKESESVLEKDINVVRDFKAKTIRIIVPGFKTTKKRIQEVSDVLQETLSICHSATTNNRRI